MTFEAIPQSQGVPRAKAICDECARAEILATGYEKKAGKWIPNTGQMVKKITGQGWTEVKGKHFCPACTAKRKVFKMKKPKTMTVTEIRKPDGKQKRLIIMALEDAYDDTKKCYRGQETDKTVAESLGGGVMPGWVTTIREDMFGPAGNEEVMKILGEIAALAAKSEKAQADFKQSLDELRKRVDAAVSAHDRRVG